MEASFKPSGDSVAIQLSGKTPYILRQQGEHFLLVGETYVHGLMKGGGLEDPDFEGKVRKIRIL
jgi:hypothetical protein